MVKSLLVSLLIVLPIPAFAGDSFTYAAPIPFISALNPSTGPAGVTVQILGSNFTGATSVKFGSNSATFTVNNDNSVAAVAPAGTGTVTVTVTTPAGTSVPPN